MKKYIKIPFIVLSGFVIVVGGLFLITYLNNEFNPDSCRNVVKQHYERMQVECPDEYLEWGYDSPEECVNNRMGLFDPEACM